jgi:hypothetical protein
MLADSMTATRSINGNLGTFRSMGSSRAYYDGYHVRGRAALGTVDKMVSHKSIRLRRIA